MKNIKKIIATNSLLIMLLLTLASSSAWASGFYVQEMSAIGMGQAGALVASGDRPSSQFANAANIGLLDGVWFEISGSTYIPVGEYENPRGDITKSTTDPIFAPQFFMSYKILPWLTIGFAEFVEFGLALDWPEGWEGGHSSHHSEISSFTLNPNIAFGPFCSDGKDYGPLCGLVIAVGFNAKYGFIDIRRSITTGLVPPGEDPSGTLRLTGDAWGFGANAGILYRPVKWMTLGFSYRSMIKMDLNQGKANFDVPTPYASRLPDQNFDSSLSLPHIIFSGVRFEPIENWTLEVDFQWVMWSVYKELEFNFSEGLEVGPGARQYTTVEEKNYKDVPQVRFGTQYKFYDNHFTVAAGILWDRNPVPDESLDALLPDSDRIIPSIAFGTEWYGFYADVGYMAVFFMDRTTEASSGTTLPGTFRTFTHNVTFTIGYHFDLVDGKPSLIK